MPRGSKGFGGSLDMRPSGLREVPEALGGLERLVGLGMVQRSSMLGWIDRVGPSIIGETPLGLRSGQVETPA